MSVKNGVLYKLNVQKGMYNVPFGRSRRIHMRTTKYIYTAILNENQPSVIFLRDKERKRN